MILIVHGIFFHCLELVSFCFADRHITGAVLYEIPANRVANNSIIFTILQALVLVSFSLLSSSDVFSDKRECTVDDAFL